MTMQAEFVKTGAAAVRRSSTKNPMEILGRLRKDDSTGSFGLLFAKWRKIVERDADLHEAALLQAFRNYWTSLDKDERKSRTGSLEMRASTAAVEAQITERVNKVIEAKAQLLLLDTLMPNGKMMRENTCREMTKLGGICAAIGKRGKPNQLVGEVLTDAQLRKLQK